jgi:hypothetical protein
MTSAIQHKSLKKHQFIQAPITRALLGYPPLMLLVQYKNKYEDTNNEEI